MKENFEEVKISVYAGMAIFNLIKDYDMSINREDISLEDKKYLSLYLGIINSKNRISLYLKENGIKFSINFNCNPELLKRDDYIQLYNKYFVDLFNEISFDSIESNLDYLLNKKIIQEFNRCNGHIVDKMVNERNKELIKAIH
ncbi:MAG: hypothetical protein IJE04_05030 [Bacilli bacterium]|nr:hypothetical protein [Bacilli bacterium]